AHSSRPRLPSRSPAIRAVGQAEVPRAVVWTGMTGREVRRLQQEGTRLSAGDSAVASRHAGRALRIPDPAALFGRLRRFPAVGQSRSPIVPRPPVRANYESLKKLGWQRELQS